MRIEKKFSDTFLTNAVKAVVGRLGTAFADRKGRYFAIFAPCLNLFHIG